MKNRASVIRLVERAQRGDAEGLNRLAGAVKVRLHEYAIRMTLDEPLAEDVVQESLLTMVQDISTLRDPGQLWPWLMKIATNKIRSHHRRNGRRSRLLAEASPPPPDGAQDAVADAIAKEVRQIVLSAMRRLPLEHRLILNMRCYEEMSFSEIAEALECRKFKARALFAKAKRTLGRNLAQSGLGRASLLGALIIFGKITATSEASGLATSVTAASLKAGLSPTLAALATTRAALVALTTVGVSAAAASFAIDTPDNADLSAADSAVAAVATQNAQARQQRWYYYPPDSGGAVLIQVRPTADDSQTQRHWFQNAEGNYVYHGRTVYRRSAHYYDPDLATMRLPTDSPTLREFLDKLEARATPMEYVRPTQRGLLVVAGANEQGPFTDVRRNYDIADEQAFQNPWQHDTRIIDSRDALHKEGWAYLRMDGRIKGRMVTATGRIPLVLAKRHTAFPWLRVTVAGSVTLEDGPNAAIVYDNTGRIRHRFSPGTFLEGLPRPWEGLHTIDTVRRDAAGRHLPFETASTKNQQANVAVMHRDMRLVYTIDLDHDVVSQITLYEREAEVGRLQFEYANELETNPDVPGEAESPRRQPPRHRRSDTLWLFSLMQAAWD